MSGSANSNLGYGNTYPNSNVNGAFVNKDSSNYAGGFSSNEIPGCPGISGTKSNIDAAASRFPMKGGFVVKDIKKDTKAKRVIKGGYKSKGKRYSKSNPEKLKLQQKIKNITKQYKMKSNKKSATKKIKHIKNRIRAAMSRGLARTMARSRSRSFAASASGGRRRSRSRSRGRRRNQRGGVYTQFMNNMPYTPNYSLGGYLNPSESALASPPTLHMNKGACLDNYNHYTGTSFPSKGH